MRIRDNGPARKTYRNFSTNSKKAAKTLERLSTGYKVNRSADDAAGLAVSEKMRAQITGLGRAESNAKEGIYLVQTAEGALDEMHEMARRLLALAEQSANGTYDDDVDRRQLQKEVDSITSEIDRIADYTNDNGIFPLKGGAEAVPELEFTNLTPDGKSYIDPSIVRVVVETGNEPLVDISDGAINGTSAPSAPWPAPVVHTVDGNAGANSSGLTVSVDPNHNELGFSLKEVNFPQSDGSDPAKCQEMVEYFSSLLPADVTALRISFDTNNSQLGRFEGSGQSRPWLPSGVSIEWQPSVSSSKLYMDGNRDEYSGQLLAMEINHVNLPVDTQSGHRACLWRLGYSTNNGADLYGINDIAASLVINYDMDANTGVKSSTLLFEKGEAPAAKATTTIDFTGRNGRDMIGSKLELGTNGAQGKFQFVTDAADAESGYTAVVVQNDTSSSGLASALNAAVDNAGGVSGFTASVDGNKLLLSETNPSGATAITASFQEPQLYPGVGSQSGVAASSEHTIAETEGTPASTTVDFSGKTGANLLGKEMLVGYNGSNGRYQFVQNAGDAKSGFTPILIAAGDDAAALAQKVSNTISAIDGYVISSEGGKLVIKESENKGANAVPVSIGTNLTSSVSGKLNASGARAGDITISMLWDTDDDLDMHVRYVNKESKESYDPGEAWDYTVDSDTIYYGSKDRAGGHLDIDANVGGRTMQSPVENVYFDNPAKGVYQIWINDYSDRNGKEVPSNATVRVQIGDQVKELTSTGVNWHTEEPLAFNSTGDKKPVYSFFYDPDDSSNWSGPKISLVQGKEKVYPARDVPAESGRPARTRVDFSGVTPEDLLGGEMRVYDESGTLQKFQFVEDAADAQSGYTPIIIGSSDSPSALAHKVQSAVSTPDGFTASTSGGVFQLTESNNNGRKAPVVGFTLRERRRVIVDDGSTHDSEDDGAHSFHKILSQDGIHLLVGETADDYNWVTVPIHDMHAESIGLGQVDVSTQSKAADSMESIRSAINKISDVRGEYGAIQNRLEHTIQNLSTTRANVQDAESLIRDTDIADEVMTQTKNNILMQTSEIMLSQASKLPEQVMSLLQ